MRLIRSVKLFTRATLMLPLSGTSKRSNSSSAYAQNDPRQGPKPGLPSYSRARSLFRNRLSTNPRSAATNHALAGLVKSTSGAAVVGEDRWSSNESELGTPLPFRPPRRPVYHHVTAETSALRYLKMSFKRSTAQKN